MAHEISGEDESANNHPHLSAAEKEIPALASRPNGYYNETMSEAIPPHPYSASMSAPVPRTALQFLRREWKVLAYIAGSIFAPVAAGILLYIIPATKGEQSVLRSDMMAADTLTRTELTGAINTTRAELTGAINTTRAELKGDLNTANAHLEEIRTNTTAILAAIRQPQQQPQFQPETAKASPTPIVAKRSRPSAAIKKPEAAGPLSWLAR